MGDRSKKLCIDLDGTLVRTDTLWESVAWLLKHRFFLFLLIPFWVLRGKVYFKERIAEVVELDVATLPYHTELIEWLKAEKAVGRSIYLVTASHERTARRVAEHLGIFDDVIATRVGGPNLKGGAKASLLVERFGERGFDYAGNHSSDVAIWERANETIVVNASPSTLRRAKALGNVSKVFERDGGLWRAWGKAVRPHQWAKNLLLFVPLFTAHQIFDVEALGQVAMCFVAFAFCASSVYVLNDLLDLESDRLHEEKRKRPFASGALGVEEGLVAFPLLLVMGFGVAYLLPEAFLTVLCVYYAMTVCYSFYFKRVLMLDVLILGGLYTIRIVAGAAGTGTHLSFWLLAFSMFIFLSLGFMKRYIELASAQSSGKNGISGRGYVPDDLVQVGALGSGSAQVAVLVLAFYLQSEKVASMYQRPEMLWGVCLVFLYWLNRVWLLAHRGLVHHDPVVYAIKDKTSYVCGAVVCLLMLLALAK